MDEEKLPEPSPEFNRAFTLTSSPSIDCGFCGRTHYATPGRDYRSGELEDLERKAVKNPDRYIRHDSSDVPWGNVEGKQFVPGCPCNSASRYEQFFLNHRDQIAKFYRMRAQTLQANAREASRIADIIGANTGE